MVDIPFRGCTHNSLAASRPRLTLHDGIYSVKSQPDSYTNGLENAPFQQLHHECKHQKSPYLPLFFPPSYFYFYAAHECAWSFWYGSIKTALILDILQSDSRKIAVPNFTATAFLQPIIHGKVGIYSVMIDGETHRGKLVDRETLNRINEVLQHLKNANESLM